MPSLDQATLGRRNEIEYILHDRLHAAYCELLDDGTSSAIVPATRVGAQDKDLHVELFSESARWILTNRGRLNRWMTMSARFESV